VWETRSGVSRSMPPGSSGATPRLQSGTPSSDRTPFPRAATPAPNRAPSVDDRSPGALVASSSPSMAVFTEPPASELTLQKKSSLGPLLLLLVVLGGGGALGYMMLNNADKTPATMQPTRGSGSANALGVTPGSGGSSAVEVVVPDGSGADTHKATPNPKTRPATLQTNVRRPLVAVADESKPSLMKQITDAEAVGDWTAQRAAYQKLGKVKGMQGQALYGEAMAAFQQGDSPAAETISKKAAAIAGPYKLKSLVLYADTIFRQGDVKRAKNNYISLRALSNDKDFKATVTKKIALCNIKLNLPERDGVLN